MTRPDQLAGMSVKELRALAAGRGVPGSAKLRKDELVAALSRSLAAPRQEPPAPATVQTGSSTPPQAAASWQPAPPEHGLPVPSAYGADRLVLMVQDPSHLFAYWEISPDTLARVQAAAGGSGTAVLVLHAHGGSESREVDLRGGNYYLAVAPGTTYTAELCLRGPDGRLHRLVASNQVATPAAGPSARTDEAWMEVDESFHDLLSLAGLPGSIGASGSRFRNTRILTIKPVGVEAEGLPVEAPAAIAGAGAGLSSLALAHAASAGESFSSHSLSSAAVASWRPQSSGALASSGALQSSRALSSRALSSRALSSGAIAGTSTLEESSYPIDGVFHAPSTGLPKAAEGVPSTPAAAAPTTGGQAPTAPGGPAPAPNAAAPAPAQDPLGFVGAPKPAAQRKPKPRRG